MNADEIVARLRLAPHPEGGWYRETYRPVGPDGSRAELSCIYYLLEGPAPARWHRVVDADEVWCYHAGAPLKLTARGESEGETVYILGPDVVEEQHPQVVIQRGQWQRARCLGDWTLVSCIVAPAFEFSSFEMTET